MGLLGLVSASLSNVSGFIYPCYASYKALSNKDNIQLERWLTYWCVVGTWTGVEGATSWVLAWVPFYSEIKLLAVLWMVAPQTEGSTLIYQRYLQPLFDSHERDVDDYLGDLKYVVGGWIQAGIAKAWKLARERLNMAAILPEQPPLTRSSLNAQHDPLAPGVPPSLHSSNSNGTLNHSSSSSRPDQAHSPAYNYAASFVQQYAPSIIAAGQAHFQQPPQQGPSSRNISIPRSTSTFEANQAHLSTPSASSSANSSGFSSRPSSMSAIEVRSRRAQLEAELAALASPPSHLPGNNGGSRPSTPPERGDSPMARSGYDEIRRDEVDGFSAGAGGGGEKRQAGGGQGWFGWGGSPRGYQKISKED